jgi:uncharacterized protein (DUF697 family)
MKLNIDDMSDKEDRAAAIILAYASAHAGIAAILANTVVGDTAVLSIMTCLMIYQLANLCERDLDAAAIAAIAGQLFGLVSGGYMASKLISWVPGFGNAVNATVTFGLTQVIGWAAFAMFNNPGLTKDEAIKYGEDRKVSKQDMEDLVRSMSDEDRARYNRLLDRLKNTGLSDSERQTLASDMADIINRYR